MLGRLDSSPGGFSQVPGENGPPPSSSEPGFLRETDARSGDRRRSPLPTVRCGEVEGRLEVEAGLIERRQKYAATGLPKHGKKEPGGVLLVLED